jgi:hypothetical protein
MEVTAQLLDALAFLLVTPEFLGETTLISIRQHLHSIGDYLSIKLIVADLGSTILVAILSAFGIILFVYGTLEYITYNVALPLSLRIVGSIFIFISLIFTSISVIGIGLYIVVSLAARLAIRRIMFGVGVVLFFLARAVSVWHAWGSEERIHDRAKIPVESRILENRPLIVPVGPVSLKNPRI